MKLPPQNRDPQRLCPCIRGAYFALLDSAEDNGILLTTIETIRQLERQAYYVNIGASRTMNSKHLPQPPNNLALAFDVVPTAYLKERHWHPKGEYWQTLGRIAEKLGLTWGGTWESFVDLPHFQADECFCPEEK